MESSTLCHRLSVDLRIYALDTGAQTLHFLSWNSHHGNLPFPWACLYMAGTMYQSFNQTNSSFGNNFTAAVLRGTYTGFLPETIYHIYKYFQQISMVFKHKKSCQLRQLFLYLIIFLQLTNHTCLRISLRMLSMRSLHSLLFQQSYSSHVFSPGMSSVHNAQCLTFHGHCSLQS